MSPEIRRLFTSGTGTELMVPIDRISACLHDVFASVHEVNGSAHAVLNSELRSVADLVQPWFSMMAANFDKTKGAAQACLADLMPRTSLVSQAVINCANIFLGQLPTLSGLAQRYGSTTGTTADDARIALRLVLATELKRMTDQSGAVNELAGLVNEASATWDSLYQAMIQGNDSIPQAVTRDEQSIADLTEKVNALRNKLKTQWAQLIGGDQSKNIKMIPFALWATAESLEVAGMAVGPVSLVLLLGYLGFMFAEAEQNKAEIDRLAAQMQAEQAELSAAMSKLNAEAAQVVALRLIEGVLSDMSVKLKDLKRALSAATALLANVTAGLTQVINLLDDGGMPAALASGRLKQANDSWLTAVTEAQSLQKITVVFAPVPTDSAA